MFLMLILRIWNSFFWMLSVIWEVRNLRERPILSRSELYQALCEVWLCFMHTKSIHWLFGIFRTFEFFRSWIALIEIRLRWAATILRGLENLAWFLAHVITKYRKMINFFYLLIHNTLWKVYWCTYGTACKESGASALGLHTWKTESGFNYGQNVVPEGRDFFNNW